ncbi:MAG: hypothetical protein IH987_15440, partial [Planctomycetes bacterium]|nr:hypothetical protein [Planctomycetota bacterium]
MGANLVIRSGRLGPLPRLYVVLAMILPVSGLQARVIKGTTDRPPQQPVDARPQEDRLDRIVQLVESSNVPDLVGHEQWR